jgi:hypothetical protein
MGFNSWFWFSSHDITGNFSTHSTCKHPRIPAGTDARWADDGRLQLTEHEVNLERIQLLRLLFANQTGNQRVWSQTDCQERQAVLEHHVLSSLSFYFCLSPTLDRLNFSLNTSLSVITLLWESYMMPCSSTPKMVCDVVFSAGSRLSFCNVHLLFHLTQHVTPLTLSFIIPCFRRSRPASDFETRLANLQTKPSDRPLRIVTCVLSTWALSSEKPPNAHLIKALRRSGDPVRDPPEEGLD